MLCDGYDCEKFEWYVLGDGCGNTLGNWAGPVDVDGPGVGLRTLAESAGFACPKSNGWRGLADDEASLHHLKTSSS